jgi:NAD(P)-dependent dehydrogenase (short-subunit alcohol dehydrogenase family)
MDIHGSIAIVTGANRGFGRHLAAELLARGAAKVYGAARNPASVDLPGVVPLQLDITDPASIAAAASLASDATILVNNAGISTHTRLTDGDIDKIRLEMETHFFGTLGVVRGFAPVISGNGGGAILNVLSALSWAHFPDYGAYSSAKAAEWAMTNVIRQELAPSGITVSGLHVGYMDTDMSDYIAAEQKVSPASVATAAIDGIQAGTAEILADGTSRHFKAALSGGLHLLYPDVAAA